MSLAQLDRHFLVVGLSPRKEHDNDHDGDDEEDYEQDGGEEIGSALQRPIELLNLRRQGPDLVEELCRVESEDASLRFI